MEYKLAEPVLYADHCQRNLRRLGYLSTCVRGLRKMINNQK